VRFKNDMWNYRIIQVEYVLSYNTQRTCRLLKDPLIKLVLSLKRYLNNPTNKNLKKCHKAVERIINIQYYIPPYRKDLSKDSYFRVTYIYSLFGRESFMCDGLNGEDQSIKFDKGVRLLLDWIFIYMYNGYDCNTSNPQIDDMLIALLGEPK